MIIISSVSLNPRENIHLIVVLNYQLYSGDKGGGGGGGGLK